MAQSIQTQKKGSFRSNVIATFLVIMIISMGVTGLVSYYFVNIIGNTTTSQSQNALEEQIQRNMGESAQKTALVIKQKLSSAETLVAAMAEECENLFRDNTSYVNRETYYDYFFENPEQGPSPSDLSDYPDNTRDVRVSWNYSSWYALGTDSLNYTIFEAANSDRLGRVSNIDYTFKYVHTQLPEFRWLYVAFNDGLFINYPGSILSGNDIDRESKDTAFYYLEDPWYQKILDGAGEMVYVEPYFDPIDQVLLISIGRAVYDPDTHQLLGIVAGDLPLDDINNRIVGVDILETGNASLVISTDYGIGVVAHWRVTPTDYEQADILGELPRFSNFENLDSSQVQAIQNAEPDTAGILNYTQNGEGMYLAYTPVGLGNFICIIIVPSAEVLEPLNALNARIAAANVQATSFIIGLTIGGALLAIIAAGVVAGQITRPLEYLMNLAMSNVEAMIKEERLDTDQLQVDTAYTAQDDEIGELARAFQGMLDSIKEEDE